MKKTNTAEFHVGDHVMLINRDIDDNDKLIPMVTVGTVVLPKDPDNRDRVGVDWGIPGCGHRMGGKCPAESGWYVDSENLMLAFDDSFDKTDDADAAFSDFIAAPLFC